MARYGHPIPIKGPHLFPCLFETNWAGVGTYAGRAKTGGNRMGCMSGARKIRKFLRSLELKNEMFEYQYWCKVILTTK